ncbi:ABC transporter permease [Paralcaligenes ureilyticus]|uniref:NitT/TauT family transport system permease protein/taurine transport system permease protein/sulfonate transport system permease protein n=1 Tax=Paralcaligenes ureilyticus TaxID=627131 RepID=A0A4V2UZ24_9BURK|nr:ABC transporter permease [Paralcaligenes ureilyticus]TCT09648.1 NitT/TauT family transport system permease protein/taurine transport system permease protein/sulfonate transport system permease protein [Paralcaligenes ureilyticus]
MNLKPYKRPRSAEAFGGARTSFAHRAIFSVISISTVLVIWGGLSHLGIINSVLVPSPADVARAVIAGIRDGSLLENTTVSMVRVLLGFVIALMIAIPLGIMMGVSRVFQDLIDPLVELLRPVPPIALIPLAILWFGIGEISKVLIITYGAFFPIFINTVAGFRDVDQVHIRAARTLGARRYEVFRDVILPSAFPQIVTGARLGMSMAFIVLVAAELIASSAGLGYLINYARITFRTDEIFVGICTIGVLGFVLNKGLIEIERFLVRWKYL